MKSPRHVSSPRRAAVKPVLVAAVVILTLALSAPVNICFAHPLGNFTINHYARLKIDGERIGIRYVVDMAEIAAFQELQKITAEGNGAPSPAELDAYAARAAEEYAA